MSIYPSGSLIGGRFEVAGRPLMGGQGIVYLCMDREVNLPGMVAELVRDTEIEAEYLSYFCYLPAMDTVAHWW